jgi:hypothetical protein
VAALTVTAAIGPGATPAAPAQITAWSSGDTIAGSDIGARGVMAIVTNASGGSLDFRVGDPGVTDAGNPAANGYTAITVPNGATRWVYIGPANVDNSSGAGAVKVGASTTNSAFTVQLARY